jgi:cytochrome o ubiquinol oxidase subunit 1
MFGRLTWHAIPFDQPIPLITSLVVLLIIAAIGIWVWRKGWAPYLWSEWVTSTDHKRIGVM